MKGNRALIAELLCLLVLSGCYRTFYSGPELSFPAAMQKTGPDEVVVSRFSEKVWNHYFVSGMFPTSRPDIEELLARHVPAGHEVRNLTILHEQSFVNGLLSSLTRGVYSPWTTVISGDVVRVKGGAL